MPIKRYLDALRRMNIPLAIAVPLMLSGMMSMMPPGDTLGQLALLPMTKSTANRFEVFTATNFCAHPLRLPKSAVSWLVLVGF